MKLLDAWTEQGKWNVSERHCTPVYVITVLIRTNMIYQSDAASNFSHKFARKQMQVSEECHTYTGRLAHFILYNLIYIYISFRYPAQLMKLYVLKLLIVCIHVIGILYMWKIFMCVKNIVWYVKIRNIERSFDGLKFYRKYSNK